MPTYPTITADLGQPAPGVSAQNLLGCCVFRDFVYAFVQGSDSVVYCKFAYLGQWQSWVALPGPATGWKSMGSAELVVNAKDTIWLFGVAQGGNVACLMFANGAWAVVPLGRPTDNSEVTGALAANTRNSSTAAPEFSYHVRTTTGVWKAVWANVCWVWAKATTQPIVGTSSQGLTIRHQGTHGFGLLLDDTTEYLFLRFTVSGGKLSCAATFTQEPRTSA